MTRDELSLKDKLIWEMAKFYEDKYCIVGCDPNTLKTILEYRTEEAIEHAVKFVDAYLDVINKRRKEQIDCYSKDGEVVSNHDS